MPTPEDLSTPISFFATTDEARWLQCMNVTLDDAIGYGYELAMLPDGRVWDRVIGDFRCTPAGEGI